MDVVIDSRGRQAKSDDTDRLVPVGKQRPVTAHDRPTELRFGEDAAVNRDVGMIASGSHHLEMTERAVNFDRGRFTRGLDLLYRVERRGVTHGVAAVHRQKCVSEAVDAECRERLAAVVSRDELYIRPREHVTHDDRRGAGELSF